MCGIDKVSKEDLAYVAGLMDGEGCIGVYHYRRGNGHHFKLSVRISNNSHHVLEYIEDTICLPLNILCHIGERKNRGSYNLDWVSNGAAVLLEALLPYLKIKYPEALVALEFQKRVKGGHRNDIKGKRLPLTDDEISTRIELVDKIKLLKENHD